MSTMTCVVHHAIRRDLAVFAIAAQATPATDRQAWKALDARWQIFADALRCHLAGTPAARPGDVLPLLQACTDGFAQASRCLGEDGRAALAIRLCALREWERRTPVGAEPVSWSMPRAKLLHAVPWVVYRLSGEARESVLRSGGPSLRLLWVFTRRSFERRQRKAFHHVLDS